MRTFRWLLIFLCFSIDIRVKAIEQEPLACLININEPCSIFTFKPMTTNLGKIELTMQPGSILYRDQNKEWNFLTGTIRISTKMPVKINTKVGVLTLGPGVQWLQWRDEKLWIYSVEGEARISLVSTNIQENVIVTGFYNWFGMIDRDGKNTQGIPRPLEGRLASTFLKGFAKHRDRKVVDKMVARNLAAAGDMYESIVAKMESDEREKRQAIERQENSRRQFDKGLRDLFRKKYLSPVDADESE